MFKVSVTAKVKFSVNVSLDDILCIAEPFVTKPSMVRHHFKPEHHMRKNGFLSSWSRSQSLNFGSYNESELFLLYVLNC